MIRQLRALLGRLRPAPEPVRAPVLPPPPTLAEELAGAGLSVDTWRIARSQRRLYSTLASDRVASVAADNPSAAAATVAAANRVCAHEFDLLGSGPYTPVDPGRPARGGYRPIDWYLDPVQGLRFPEKVPHNEWDLLKMRPGLADVKLPWELGRCQHWLPLAQAFRLTGDARYATEIFDQHDDFMEANPIGLGVNWTCTMDVAIRALNWAMALELIDDPAAVDPARADRLFASVFAHGHFIVRNLENKYEVTSNHFLSNVVGLFGVAAMFRDLPSGRLWFERCGEWLEQEMRVQVLDDGADYESSVPYHRLVAELFLSAWRTAEHAGAPLSPGYETKLRAMMAFLHAVLRPDGRLPQVGDADDGRVHIFSDYGRWQPQDARHLLAAAAAVLDSPAFAGPADEWSRWEGAWWGAESPRAAAVAAAPVRRLFQDAGIAVVRDERDFLLITNGKVGTNGFGNHKHNDLLSFEFHQHGVPLFVDPGSYVYTSDPAARNQFRSTASHNTLMIDAEEQNEFKPEWLFRMFEKARPEHVAFESSEPATRYHGRHDGYARLAAPVNHEREFHLDHRSGRLQIADRLDGLGSHNVRWHFHCAPGVTASVSSAGALALAAAGRTWTLRFDETLTPSMHAGWYSPSYGVRHACVTIAFAATVASGGRRQWSFAVEPQP